MELHKNDICELMDEHTDFYQKQFRRWRKGTKVKFIKYLSETKKLALIDIEGYQIYINSKKIRFLEKGKLRN